MVIARLYVAIVATFLLCASTVAAERISVREAARRAQAGELVLVDVRTPREWQETGVPAPAHLLDMLDPQFPDAFAALYDAAAGRPVALICDAGVRTGWLTDALEARGYQGLADVSAGMSGSRYGPGWLELDLPLRDYRPETRLAPLTWWQRWRLGREPDWHDPR